MLSPFVALRVNSAKHLAAERARPFASLRACPERSEWGDTGLQLKLTLAALAPALAPVALHAAHSSIFRIRQQSLKAIPTPLHRPRPYGWEPSR
jgi:hypothetical protein